MNINALYDFRQNRTGITQRFNDRYQNPVTAAPGAIFDAKELGNLSCDEYPKIDSVISHALNSGSKEIILNRFSATGDIIMLVPVVRYLKKNYGLDAIIRTYPQIEPILNFLGVGTIPERNSSSRIEIMLQGVVERDHLSPAAQEHHRTVLYLRAMGAREKIDATDLNWDGRELGIYKRIQGPYVALQSSGSGLAKALTLDTVDHLIKGMIEIGWTVVLLNKIKLTKRPMVHYLDEWGTLEQLYEVIAGAEFLICMDSLPLWISHFTKTPTIAILGPTPEKNRILLHPLYPEGAMAIQTNNWINCPSCFEAAKDCGYKFKCLNADKERLLQEIVNHGRNFWGSEDAL